MERGGERGRREKWVRSVRCARRHILFPISLYTGKYRPECLNRGDQSAFTRRKCFTTRGIITYGLCAEPTVMIGYRSEIYRIKSRARYGSRPLASLADVFINSSLNEK